MGKKKALVALGHTILRIVFHILDKRIPYAELGPDYLERFRQRNEDRKEEYLIRQLEAKGFVVTRSTN